MRTDDKLSYELDLSELTVSELLVTPELNSSRGARTVLESLARASSR